MPGYLLWLCANLPCCCWVIQLLYWQYFKFCTLQVCRYYNSWHVTNITNYTSLLLLCRRPLPMWFAEMQQRFPIPLTTNLQTFKAMLSRRLLCTLPASAKLSYWILMQFEQFRPVLQARLMGSASISGWWHSTKRLQPARVERALGRCSSWK